MITIPLALNSVFFGQNIQGQIWDNQTLLRASPFFGTNMFSTCILHENILSTFCCLKPFYRDTWLESLLFFRPFLILFMTPALDTVTVPTISALDTVKSTL